MMENNKLGVCEPPDVRLKQLLEVANRVEVIYGLSIQQYLRAMRSMVQMVDAYLQTGKKEDAYKLAMKFSILYLEQLPKHPEYRTLAGIDKDAWDRRANTMLTKAERLKSELNVIFKDEYNKYQAKVQQEEVERLKAKEAIAAAVKPDLPDSEPTVLPNAEQPANDKPPVPLKSILKKQPSVDRSLKPPTSNNAYRWASVRMSVQGIIQNFLRLSERNTRENRETCASLCGVVVNGEFHVTDLVFLKQSGTPDSCTTYKEEELFDHAEKKGLIELGWVHTHPTQTAFLSSVDQHCQLSYQIMLPEAIAIVCAPKYNEVKIFSLTPDYGIPTIRSCREIGFHQHPKLKPIFEESKHVVDDPSVRLVVTDLR